MTMQLHKNMWTRSYTLTSLTDYIMDWLDIKINLTIYVFSLFQEMHVLPNSNNLIISSPWYWAVHFQQVDWEEYFPILNLCELYLKGVLKKQQLDEYLDTLPFLHKLPALSEFNVVTVVILQVHVSVLLFPFSWGFSQLGA